ncbi:MAG TPA: c-type cytochrome domain-containing protein [Chitinophagaceae bacterium]|nr:c-type cytochrome domain-containing protein [Chitinophagaceae bacterium]
MVELIGHFHPLLVHLPIGILVLAFLMSLLPESKRIAMQSAMSLSLAVAAISSALACVAGFLLANSGDYEADLVSNHQWAGIATSALCFAAWLAPKFNRQILWGTVVTLAVASHMGGTLTHGEGYLFPDDDEIPMVADSSATITDTIAQFVSDSVYSAPVARQVFMYRDEITPILKTKCYNCHSAVKKKGGLRLDSESFISKGGKNGEVLVKGDPNKSPLYTNLLLPMEDDKHMPPKGKKQLNRQEIELIHRWIRKGAPFGSVEILPTAREQPVAAPMPLIPVEHAGEQDPPPSKPKATVVIPAADAKVVNSLLQQGIVVDEVAEGANALSLNFVNVKEVNGSMIRDLNSMYQQITTLKFTGLPITDQVLRNISALPNLEKIQLEKTHISDAGVAELNKFPNLETVNLYGTNITDSGLKNLANANLKKINLWNTKVTQQGIRSLQSKHPDLEIEAGQLSLKKVDSTRKK